MAGAVSFYLPLLGNKVTAGRTGAKELATGSLETGETGQYPLARGTFTLSKTSGQWRLLS